MKEIKLTKNKTALIDDADYLLISHHKWCTLQTRRKYYAVSNIKTTMGAKLIRMHIFLLGKKAGFEIDHINNDSLDNRRSNLRHVTRAQNQYNRSSATRGSSKFKGVSKRKGRKYEAYIQHNRVGKHLGYFHTELEAASAYNDAARKLFGKYACLNVLK